MLRMEYHVNSAEWQKLAVAAATGLDEARLRYYYLWGTVSLFCAGTARGLSFEAPVLDFVLSCQRIEETLRAENTARYEFTESTAGVSLVRGAGRVTLSADFAEWTCECTCEDLEEGARELVVRVLDDVCHRVPELCGNPAIVQARAACVRDRGSA